MDRLISELRRYSSSLSEMDKNEDNGIMTTIRFETIDVVGRACIELDRLQKLLRYIYDSTAEDGQWEESGVHNIVKAAIERWQA